MGATPSSPQEISCSSSNNKSSSGRFSDFTLYPDRFEPGSYRNSSSPRSIPHSVSTYHQQEGGEPFHLQHQTSTNSLSSSSFSSSGSWSNNSTNTSGSTAVVNSAGWEPMTAAGVDTSAAQQHAAVIGTKNSAQYRFADFSLYPDRFTR